MQRRSFGSLGLVPLVGLLILTACAAPAAPTPTTAPAKPAEAAKPAAAPSPPAAASPSPGASPSPSPSPSPAASPAAAVATKPSFDERAVADFYRGKTVTVIVGFGPGGGYDTYARLVARHIGKYIPGNPNVIVQNMPGGGSVTAMNHTYSQAPKDGTVMAHFHGGYIMQQFLGNRTTEFDSAKINWIGSAKTDTPACAVHKQSGFTTLAQAMPDGGGRELIMGGTGLDYVANVLRLALNINLKMVTGYDGTAQIRLAAERGEVYGFCTAWESIKPTWAAALSSGDARPIVQAGRTPHPDLRDVPRAQDLAKTPESKQIVEYGITLPAEFARPFGMAPEVPRDRVLAMRQAFDAAIGDAELRDEAQKSQLDIELFTGAQLEEAVNNMFRMPPNIKTILEPIRQN